MLRVILENKRERGTLHTAEKGAYDSEFSCLIVDFTLIVSAAVVFAGARNPHHVEYERQTGHDDSYTLTYLNGESEICNTVKHTCTTYNTRNTT